MGNVIWLWIYVEFRYMIYDVYCKETAKELNRVIENEHKDDRDWNVRDKEI